MNDAPDVITLEMMRQSLYTAVVCDVLDSLGFKRQSPRAPLKPLSVDVVLVGRAKTTLWSDLTQADPAPYEKELIVVDDCRPDDVLIAAAGGSTRSGIWGELLSTAARNRGCQGAIVDGAVRDVAKMRAMQFPVFALGTSPYDSKDRQRVTDIDVPVEIDGVAFHPGELVLADIDGVVVVPHSVEDEAIRLAWQKVHAENLVRTAIQEGLKATEAYRRFGVL
jgi:4-hydroxy-4-methyl-2-oxoglutarate aldolase